MSSKRILMSGGSGLLGTVVQSLDATVQAPPHHEMDVTDPASLDAALLRFEPETFLHAAAFTSPPRTDEDPSSALEINIVGTANVVRACMSRGVRLVYLSTDYVFRGDRGMYKEEDELYPQNKYAWSKLGGECAVRLYDRSLIIRTSFIQDEFPYEKAFADQYTSRDTVSVIAPMVLAMAKSDACGVIHIGTQRKSVLELARRSRPQVGSLTRQEVPFTVPYDTSLDISKLKSTL
jgi:dTDP-4-dehydrorhamnose reductase